MCKYCTIEELDDHNLISYKKRALKLRRSQIGFEDISVSIGHKGGESKWSIMIEHGVTDTALEVIDYFEATVKIKYCPFCGEKLTDRTID